MKKKLVFSLLLLVFITFLSGCTSKSALEFKNDYEALNGKESASGKIHRTITIDKNNPFERVTPEELLEKIENKETFYVYFGDELCPWCRSVIEKFIEIAKEKNVKKVYYVKIWDQEGTEILRSKFKLNDNNEIEEVIKGTDAYYKLLEVFDNVLTDYTLTDSNGNNVAVGEKRIYAPNFMYVEEGLSVKLTEGISPLQTDARGELTKEILDDETRMFNEFFE